MLEGMLEYWNRLVNSGDVRSNELPFIRDPTVLICVIFAYLVMVIVGPRWMEKRNPLSLRKILIGYNFVCVLFSMWMLWEFFASSFLNPDFNLFIQEIYEDDTSPKTMRLVNVHWWFFFSKFIEFADTAFFIVRKKNNQISFLHVYHHISMLILQWSMVKYVPGGGSYFGPMLNCFIHSVMYLYYMLSAVGPHMQKYLWWKKYLTRMQMSQFVFISCYCINLIIYCTMDIGRMFAWLHLCYLLSMFLLFNNFYQIAYVKRKKSDLKETKSIGNNKTD